MSIRVKIKKGDNVLVLSGRDRHKSGTVLKVIPSNNRLVVEKINMVKKHLKPTKSSPKGGLVETEMPLVISNVMIICPHCAKPTRIGRVLAGDKKYVRICRKCKQMLDIKK